MLYDRFVHDVMLIPYVDKTILGSKLIPNQSVSGVPMWIFSFVYDDIRYTCILHVLVQVVAALPDNRYCKDGKEFRPWGI